VRPGNDTALRTRVYVDGYNLYYGCLKNTPHKWLDVLALVERILRTVLCKENDVEVSYRLAPPALKFFTAPILTAFARSDDSVSCQANYHNALRGHLGDALEIILGYHDARPARARAWREGMSARECAMLEIWKLEEKQSDVSLALHAFGDAVRGEVGHVIAVTNDSDFAPAMRMIRQHTRAIVGLIVPARKATNRVNAELARHAHWVRSCILDEELAKSQLPMMVRSKSRVMHKPTSWYPRPDLLIPIYEEARRVTGSEGAARKWLNQPCAYLAGRVPIEMCEAAEPAAELRAYMDRYASEFGI
jgi:6-hydroxy-3-succinoylpyridine 3-monooxygenase